MTAAVEQYRASCKGCDWTAEGSRTEIDAAIKQHRADHRATRPKVARCPWNGCDWTMRGGEKWVRAAWERHRTEHREAAAAREARREARYRWKGRPNPTQVRLLRAVEAGQVQGYECQVYVFNDHFTVWYPTGLPRRDQLWWPALVEAGLVRPRPTFRRGRAQEGVWRLTDAGREILADVP